MGNQRTECRPDEQIQELSIKIPLRLAERVKAYADATENTVAGVVIEALDQFLREQKTV